MRSLIEKIGPESRLVIGGTTFAVLGKSFFVTESNPGSRYAKIFCERHRVLLISPDDGLLYFGQDRGNLGDDLMTRDSFSYEEHLYKRVAADYQIVVEACFGDPLETEGEVHFVDFMDKAETGSISLGLVMRTQKRADVVAQRIDIDAIDIL